ncbi:ABC transporter ATP-binding protein [Nonomuraea rubra]|uniref:ABC transporter ATP-binding protein n=1 Tax=Nonomuraea rubra TaxID=46180 RepID=UPI0031E854BF
MSSDLVVEDLVAGYGDAQVLHGVRFTVREGEVCAILGPNGAGKTTLLRALSGMVRTRGTITLGGVPLAGRSPDAVARLGVAHVPEGRGTFMPLTVEENLRLGAYVRRGPAVNDDLERIYQYFPVLKKRLKQAAGSLSGGEQQMLALGRALMLRPRVLLLDEPSLGLAPLVTRELFPHRPDHQRRGADHRGRRRAERPSCPGRRPAGARPGDRADRAVGHGRGDPGRRAGRPVLPRLPGVARWPDSCSRSSRGSARAPSTPAWRWPWC